MLVLAHCGLTAPSDDDDSSGATSGGSAGASATGGSSATGGVSATGGAGGAGGTGGATGGSGGNVGGTGGVTGGTGGTSGGAGGVGGTAGVTGGVGGTTGGAAGVGGAQGGFGGTAGSGGSIVTGGMGGTAGSSGGAGGAGTAGMGPIVNMNGVPLAKPGDQKTGSREYLNLGDMRLLNNKWGSDELGCNTTMRVFANTDKSLGWDFNRGTCGGANAKPDYPEIEFGVHPFGAGNSLATSPDFSLTLLLPKQMKDITSASVTIDNLVINLQGQQSWNLNFEFWLSQGNPLEANPGVHAELITFWGWQDGRWPCDKTGNVNAGDKGYHLCHQDDNWASGQWRYFQFWVDNGPNRSFSGKVNVKALMEWLVNNYGYSRDLWVTRFEVGTEIDDNTSGTATIKNITFEVNGTSKSPQFAQ